MNFDSGFRPEPRMGTWEDFGAKPAQVEKPALHQKSHLPQNYLCSSILGQLAPASSASRECATWPMLNAPDF
jgi:hypothetical protein